MFWESFDAINRNQSLCHWTHSGVGEWLWRNVVGLNSDQEHPGSRSMTIRPRPTKEVYACRAKNLFSSWRHRDSVGIEGP
jgi:hypothetical protein